MFIYQNIMKGLAGLAIFIVAIKLMSGSLKSITGKKIEKVITFLNKNYIFSCLVGVIFTTMIQSSDGAVALAIGLVAAGFLDLKTAIAFILGANIGTATTSIIVATSDIPTFNYIKYSLYLFSFIGAFGWIIFSDEKKTRVATLLFSLGAIFVGLYVMGLGFKPLAKSLSSSLKNFKSPFLAMLSSIVLTGIFQSSSAVVTIVQEFYASQKDSKDAWSQGIFSTQVALGMVIGANIGTTFTALIASLGNRNKDTKRIALIWLFTNTIMAIIIMPMVSFGNSPFSELVKKINSSAILYEGKRMNSKFDLAIGHMLFNTFLVILFLPFTKQLAWLSNKIIKTKQKNKKTNYQISLPQTLLYESPQIAYKTSKKAVSTLGEMQRDAIIVLTNYLKEPTKEGYKDFLHLQDIINKVRTNISLFLVQLGSRQISRTIANRIMSLTLCMRAFDSNVNLGEDFLKEFNKAIIKRGKTIEMNKDMISELIQLLLILSSSTKRAYKIVRKNSIKNNKELNELNSAFTSLIEKFRTNHLNRQIKKLNINKVDSLLLLQLLERMNRHIVGIVKYQNFSKNKTEPFHISKELSQEIKSLNK
ncbi:MAG: Na/Pi cotransporter family protein [Mycoplasma sp.]|nr:Na/Pi cotransporter family protein [Mycoplasma sp.]